MTFSPAVTQGVGVGLAVAFGQSVLSLLAMRWAWTKKSFYWVWGGCIFFRMLVFAATAFVLIQYTALSWVAALLTMAVATTFFLIIESWFLIHKNK